MSVLITLRVVVFHSGTMSFAGSVITRSVMSTLMRKISADGDTGARLEFGKFTRGQRE
jgi:hypothetical protein